ncbi:hypothetical protein BDP27DRAFT_1416202 [Rhodocollybia butyracea]|uniref:Uncharacterized protein n=1 Tax=Rhodocollybia butyracea TaxID=206335 RepID=A0A9P5Q4V0_9AGAR|nr:hypothetical protein BDP27DRAFT_1416202 [Rhodocollybia butyracea]
MDILIRGQNLCAVCSSDIYYSIISLSFLCLLGPYTSHTTVFAAPVMISTQERSLSFPFQFHVAPCHPGVDAVFGLDFRNATPSHTDIIESLPYHSLPTMNLAQPSSPSRYPFSGPSTLHDEQNLLTSIVASGLGPLLLASKYANTVILASASPPFPRTHAPAASMYPPRAANNDHAYAASMVNKSADDTLLSASSSMVPLNNVRPPLSSRTCLSFCLMGNAEHGYLCCNMRRLYMGYKSCLHLFPRSLSSTQMRTSCSHVRIAVHQLLDLTMASFV